MTDTISKAKRSETMRRVKGEDTRPERLVRSLLHGLGARFRLETGRTLPGHPDVVLPSRRIVIFIHGCFWHQHSCPRGARRPSSNVAYWNRKLDRNIDRDRRVSRELRELGWQVVVVWECETRKRAGLTRRLNRLIPQR